MPMSSIVWTPQRIPSAVVMASTWTRTKTPYAGAGASGPRSPSRAAMKSRHSERVSLD
jgi:hypothetical protein